MVFAMSVAIAYLGGGCFWCLEAVFQRRSGVLAIAPGYAAGHDPAPDYKKVCTGTTGHAEVVAVTYDPETVGYAELLELFWACHDPTTLNRQGEDVGSQYRSIILWQTEAERLAAEASRTAAQPEWSDPIVTQIEPLEKFFPAEDYHFNYFNQHGSQGYCSLVIAPKVRKLIAKGKIRAD